jgi:hypothetical protein
MEPTRERWLRAASPESAPRPRKGLAAAMLGKIHACDCPIVVYLDQGTGAWLRRTAGGPPLGHGLTATLPAIALESGD